MPSPATRVVSSYGCRPSKFPPFGSSDFGLRPSGLRPFRLRPFGLRTSALQTSALRLFGPSDFGPSDFGPSDFGPSDFGVGRQPPVQKCTSAVRLGCGCAVWDAYGPESYKPASGRFGPRAFLDAYGPEPFNRAATAPRECTSGPPPAAERPSARPHCGPRAPAGYPVRSARPLGWPPPLRRRSRCPVERFRSRCRSPQRHRGSGRPAPDPRAGSR
jgi:hypothetical protein